MTSERKYSRLDILLNVGMSYLGGSIVGGIEGLVGSLAVPTSVRKINDNLDRNLDEAFGNNEKRTVEDKVGNLVYHSTRLVARLSTHGTVMYKMMFLLPFWDKN